MGATFAWPIARILCQLWQASWPANRHDDAIEQQKQWTLCGASRQQPEVSKWPEGVDAAAAAPAAATTATTRADVHIFWSYVILSLSLRLIIDWRRRARSSGAQSSELRKSGPKVGASGASRRHESRQSSLVPAEFNQNLATKGSS